MVHFPRLDVQRKGVDPVSDGEAAILALSAENMVKLTGLTMRQLAYWDRIGFFKPEYASDNRRSPQSRVYSFQDAVGLRTIAILMNVYSVTLPHLKQVAKELESYTARPWSELKLHVWKRRVQFDEPETGGTRDVLNGQYLLLPIIDVIHEVESAVEKIKERKSDQIGRFERRRNVSRNALVVAGTRIPVSTILEYLDDGYSTPEIVKEFPLLTEKDVQSVSERGRQAIAA